MLAHAFILLTEQQRSFLEHQHQMLKLLQRLVENPQTINFIAIEMDDSVSIKGNLMVDKSTTDASEHEQAERRVFSVF